MHGRAPDEEILRVERLCKRFAKRTIFGRRSGVMACDDVTFGVRRGEVFVLAGESGSGKSTIARAILGAVEPDSGQIFFDGREADTRKIRAGCQMIHQDPYDSVNPRMRVGDIVAEPLEILGVPKGERHGRVIEALAETGLEPAADIAERYPHMLSGGQRQRVVLARALSVRPEMILADEPVSMLDVSVRAEMLELMQKLRERHGISFLYITHDLATARHFGDRIGILYRGRIVETGPINSVLDTPRHPYTRALIDAVSEPDPKNRHVRRDVRIRDGETVNDGRCRFHARCPCAIEECMKEPRLREVGSGRYSACYVDF